MPKGKLSLLLIQMSHKKLLAHKYFITLVRSLVSVYLWLDFMRSHLCVETNEVKDFGSRWECPVYSIAKMRSSAFSPRIIERFKIFHLVFKRLFEPESFWIFIWNAVINLMYFYDVTSCLNFELTFVTRLFSRYWKFSRHESKWFKIEIII